jgi:uncharacterized protein
MKCPVCQNETVAQYSPFCSKGCKNIDLIKWLNGSYRIPTEEVVDEEAVHQRVEDEEYSHSHL